MTLLWLLGASLLGSVVAVLLAATTLLAPAPLLKRLLPRMISFSTGALLAAALLGMLPRAAAALDGPTVFAVVLGGVLVFFVLEKLLVWRHCHKQHDCDVHASSGPLLIIGDAVHNLIDGVVLAAAFLESPALGLAATLSTVAHEVPQELGEFLVYLHGGWSRRRALAWNLATSLTTFVGALLGYFFLSHLVAARPYLMGFAAAGFLYVALADLIPAQRGKSSLPLTLLDFVLVLAGVALIGFVARAHA
jgi:zinc and cadmium transporter